MVFFLGAGFSSTCGYFCSEASVLACEGSGVEVVLERRMVCWRGRRVVVRRVARSIVVGLMSELYVIPLW